MQTNKQANSGPVNFFNYYYYNDNFPDILQTYTDIPMPKRQKPVNTIYTTGLSVEYQRNREQYNKISPLKQLNPSLILKQTYWQ